MTCDRASNSLVCAASYTPALGSTGTQKIAANYMGDSSNAPSSNSFSLIALDRNASVSVACVPSSPPASAETACTSMVNDSSSGIVVTPTGLVSFSSNGTGSFNQSSCTLASGSCSVSYSPAYGSEGAFMVTASYGGDTGHTPGVGTFVLSVGKRSASVSVVCSPASVSVDQTASCGATVKDTSPGTPFTPTGTLTLSSSLPGEFSAGTCTLVSESCSFNYTPSLGSEGTNMIRASYSGDAEHVANSTSGKSFPLLATTRGSLTSVVCDQTKLAVNTGMVCTATVADNGNGTSTMPTGNLTFSSSPPGIFSHSPCALFSGSCTFSFSPGSHEEGNDSLIVAYNGDRDHSISSGEANVTVTKRGVTFSVDCGSSFTNNTEIPCKATVSDTSGGTSINPSGTVTFSDGSAGGSFAGTCSLSTGTCSLYYTTPPGEGVHVTITATYPGDSDHVGSSWTTSFVTT